VAEPVKTRRIRYSGKNPRTFKEKYKEQRGDEEVVEKVKIKGGTPAGQHRPIMLSECMQFMGLEEQDSEGAGVPIKSILGQSALNVVDCTLGYGGHSMEIMRRIHKQGGSLYALDQDASELEKTKVRLQECALALGGSDEATPQLATCFHENFGDLQALARTQGILGQVHAVLADLGYSSMQVDDPLRGFTYKYDGPLDLRMDQRSNVTAVSFLSSMKSVGALADVLQKNSDEIHAYPIAKAILKPSGSEYNVPLTTTAFADRVREALKAELAKSHSPLPEKKDQDKCVARCLQAVRIEVNKEFDVLERLLSDLPDILAPGGRAVFLTFHSGEDRRVKKALKGGFKDGTYSAWGRDVVLASHTERNSNPRSKCAKLRWAVRACAES